MMRSAYRRVFLSRAPIVCAWATCVCTALLGTATTVQAGPGDTELISVSPATGVSSSAGSFGGSISGDGRFVVFCSDSSDLLAGASNLYHVYLRDRGAGTTERISVTSSGLQGNASSCATTYSISADGRYVAFGSRASNLVPGDTNGIPDVFVRDRQTGTTERVSVSISSTFPLVESYEPSISADGRYVAWSARNTNYNQDVFVRDRETGITSRVSIATDGRSMFHSGSAALSADGRYVAFVGSDDGYLDHQYIFVRDRQAGTTERVDLSVSGEPANDQSYLPAISADGRYVAFGSLATNLVPGDTNGTADVFVRDRVAGTCERVNVSSTGVQANYLVSNRNIRKRSSISADGRYVAFGSWATNLVANDNNAHEDIFVRDRQLRTTVWASVSSSGLQGNDESYDAALSSDGRFVTFTSWASNLVTNADWLYQVYVHELGGTSPPIGETAFAVKPTALALGNQALFTSATLSVWVTNKGTTALPIISVGVVGLNPGMFSANNRCGNSVAVGASCSVRVTFRPTSVGAKSAKLRIVAGDNDVRTKALSGTGVVSAFTVSPTSLDFGSVPINTTNPARIVTVSNTGSAVLPISSITVAGWNPYQFAQTHNCPANLAVSASCTIKVVFKPNTPIGSKAALLNVTPGGGAAIRSVALAGAARR